MRHQTVISCWCDASYHIHIPLLHNSERARVGNIIITVDCDASSCEGSAGWTVQT